MADQTIDFNLDGTLSMQGFARASGEQFAEFLQELELSLSSHWPRSHIRYHRFGSVIEDLHQQQPFYVVASREDFFQRGKNYAETRIDNVFRKSAPGNLTLVMTDLFEQNLDIEGIEDSLKSASFPNGASLAIWQWHLPFSGPIYDFDIRTSQGQTYTGPRPIYLLALGPEDSLRAMQNSIGAGVKIGQAAFLLISGTLASNPNDWLTVTQTQNLGLVRRSPGDANSAPYSVYRASNGCSTAAISARAHITPTTEDTIAGTFTPRPGGYEAELFSVSGTSVHPTAKPSVETNKQTVTVRLDCVAVGAYPLELLRVRRLGTTGDVALPAWVSNSSASSMEFNAAFQRHQAAWGDKTLNLAPLVRVLANRAVDGTVVATAYFYFVRD